MKFLLVLAALLAVSAAQFIAPYVAHTGVAHTAVVAPYSYEGTHLYRARRSPVFPVAASTAIHAPVVSAYGAYPYVHTPYVYRHRRGVVTPVTGVVAPVARVAPVTYTGLTHPTYAHASFSHPFSYHY